VPGLGQLRIGLSQGGSWTNDLPAGTDVTGFTHVQVRLVPDYESGLAATGSTALSIELSDGGGATASVVVTLDAPPGDLEPLLPRKLLHTVRVPLEEFAGVDLSDLASVALRSDDTTAALLVSDLAFADEPPPDRGTGTTGGTTVGDDDTGDDSPADTDTTTGVEPEPEDDDEGGTGGDSTGEAAPATGNDAGCGCRSGGRGAWMLLPLLGVPLVRRRGV
jgi:hypothetical protein